MGRSYKNTYCAFCRSERKVYTKKGISLINIFAAAVTATTIMLALWQDFNVRVIVIFVMVLALTEVLIQMRWRMSLVCPHCGFDPILYINDRKQACEKVKVHLDNRMKKPSILLSRNAKLNLPYRRPEQGELTVTEINDNIEQHSESPPA
jgi:hypothetical protein